MLIFAVQQSDSAIYIYTHTYIYFFFIFFHYGLSQDIEYSSLCRMVGPCCPSILYVRVCITSPKLPVYPPRHLLGLLATMSVLYVWVYFCFVDSSLQVFIWMFCNITSLSNMDKCILKLEVKQRQKIHEFISCEFCHRFCFHLGPLKWFHKKSSHLFNYILVILPLFLSCSHILLFHLHYLELRPSFL